MFFYSKCEGSKTGKLKERILMCPMSRFGTLLMKRIRRQERGRKREIDR